MRTVVIVGHSTSVTTAPLLSDVFFSTLHCTTRHAGDNDTQSQPQTHNPYHNQNISTTQHITGSQRFMYRKLTELVIIVIVIAQLHVSKSSPRPRGLSVERMKRMSTSVHISHFGVACCVCNRFTPTVLRASLWCARYKVCKQCFSIDKTTLLFCNFPKHCSNTV